MCGPHVGGEMRNVCSIRPVAGDGGLNTEDRIRTVNRAVWLILSEQRRGLKTRKSASHTHTHTETT